MKSFFVSVLVLLCSHAFSQSLFEGPNCNTRTFKTALTGDLHESTVLGLMLALDHDTVTNIIEFCGRASLLPEEQMACLKDLSSNDSFKLDEPSQKILSHIGENFTSLDEFIVSYDKEKKE